MVEPFASKAKLRSGPLEGAIDAMRFEVALYAYVSVLQSEVFEVRLPTGVPLAKNSISWADCPTFRPAFPLPIRDPARYGAPLMGLKCFSLMQSGST